MTFEQSEIFDFLSKNLDYNYLLELVKKEQKIQFISIDKLSIDQIGNSVLPRVIDGEFVSYSSWPTYWENLKNEFKLLVCTKDKKYNTLRKKLAKVSKKSHTTIVSTIAAAMASQFGVVAGVLVPFCALCIIAILRLGKEAFCAAKDIEITIK